MLYSWSASFSSPELRSLRSVSRIESSGLSKITYKHSSFPFYKQTVLMSLTSLDPEQPIRGAGQKDRSSVGDNREIKIHVYGILQTANVSWEFLRIENKQVKTVHNYSCGQNWHKTTYFCVEAIKSKRKIRGKLGHVVQIHVCRLA